MIQDNMDELLTGLRNIFARKMRVIDQMPTLVGKELVKRFQMDRPPCMSPPSAAAATAMPTTLTSAFWSLPAMPSLPQPAELVTGLKLACTRQWMW